MLELILQNKEILGLFFAALGVIPIFIGKKKDNTVKNSQKNNSIAINNIISTFQNPIANNTQNTNDLEKLKNTKKILFIDDDSKFKVVQILINSGWIHTNTIKDVKSIDCTEIVQADILFVDIQGVGKLLSFADEGLGLAAAIKEKYPQKKVVIYSAETKGDRFHKALKKVDSSLPKNADPYEFQQIVEEFSQEK